MTTTTAIREVKGAAQAYANGADLPRAQRIREALNVLDNLSRFAREFDKLGTVKVKV